jgi:hypothetical protein
MPMMIVEVEVAGTIAGRGNNAASLSYENLEGAKPAPFSRLNPAETKTWKLRSIGTAFRVDRR